MSQSWWSSNQSDCDKWDSWPKKLGGTYFKEENARSALNLEKSSALTQNGKQLSRQKFCWKRCWGYSDSQVGYVSTMSYYYSKSKHEALLLRAACLVPCSELQQMWRQFKRKKGKWPENLKTCPMRQEWKNQGFNLLNEWLERHEKLSNNHTWSSVLRIPLWISREKNVLKLHHGRVTLDISKKFSTIDTRQECMRKRWNSLL